MSNNSVLSAVLQAGEQRREERRRFLKVAGGAAAMAGGMTLLSSCGDDDDGSAIILQPTPTGTPTATAGAPTEADVLNFALNLEYLEAQFYSFAAFGRGLDDGLLTGTGTQGAVTGGRQVNFTDPLVRQYAREIAMDEIAHVAFLRQALGNARVAQPAINISGDANGAFTAAARAAGVVPATGTFDPYASDEAFLLGAFLFEDVGVTAYMGGVELLSTPAFIEAAAGIHAVEAYHAGLVRTVLFNKGIQTPSANIFQNVQRISDARDTLDGTANSGRLNQGGDRDQGIGDATTANLVPADANAIAFVRSPSQVLNIVYLSAGANIAGGGFFPAGVNGNVRSTT